MDIQVVAVSPVEQGGKNGKAWNQVHIDFISKNGAQKRTVRDFEGEVFKQVQALTAGDNASVTVVKEGKFWNWKAVSKSAGSAGSPTSVGSPAPTGGVDKAPAKKGDWETKEERADRQHLH
jgi:hypothetical protein